MLAQPEYRDVIGRVDQHDNWHISRPAVPSVACQAFFSLGSNPSETKGNPLTLGSHRHHRVHFHTSDPAPCFRASQGGVWNYALSQVGDDCSEW